MQSDVERADDDAILEANPRPRLRGDCEGAECPHCAATVLMRLGEDEEGLLKITCPACGGRVTGMAVPFEAWIPWDGSEVGITPGLLNRCRPCPWVGCVHHLFLDPMDNGASIRMNFPGKEPGELQETCSLDVADRDGATLDEVGKTINITRERVRQLIEQGVRACRKNTNTAMFGSRAIDVEDINDLPELRHPLTEAE